ncbi:hypothetical protein GC197_06610 [bacterium]|nr:hypothetical protein [bacterium]
MSQPAHKIRIGVLQVTIWRNHGERGAWYSVIPTRRGFANASSASTSAFLAFHSTSAFRLAARSLFPVPPSKRYFLPR